jgi:predicted nucleic acid-binding protein
MNGPPRLKSGALDLIGSTDDLRYAAEIALAIRHRLPDCLYLALAERLDVPLVTADMAFHAKASPRFPRIAPLVAA